MTQTIGRADVRASGSLWQRQCWHQCRSPPLSAWSCFFVWRWQVARARQLQLAVPQTKYLTGTPTPSGDFSRGSVHLRRHVADLAVLAHAAVPVTVLLYMYYY